MKFAETIKLTAPELIVSRRHDAWSVKNDAHPAYTTEALDFALHQLRARDRVRRGTLSASSLGECQRYQQFVYLGMPKLPPDEKNAAKMQNGSFMHMRWQMEGLSEGWLHKAEVPVANNPFQLSGTMDGILYEGSVLELKSANVNGFSRLRTFGPALPHLFQMATYLMTSLRDRGVFIYECKDNQEYKEIVVTAEDLPMEEARVMADKMWNSIADQKLFEPLGKCIDKEGWMYNSCPFRNRCLQIHDWEEVAWA